MAGVAAGSQQAGNDDADQGAIPIGATETKGVKKDGLRAQA